MDVHQYWNISLQSNLRSIGTVEILWRPMYYSLVYEKYFWKQFYWYLTWRSESQIFRNLEIMEIHTKITQNHQTMTNLDLKLIFNKSKTTGVHSATSTFAHLKFHNTGRCVTLLHRWAHFSVYLLHYDVFSLCQSIFITWLLPYSACLILQIDCFVSHDHLVIAPVHRNLTSCQFGEVDPCDAAI